MRVLVACEFSGTVREAFATRGHDAWSCDRLPTERPGQHYQCDVCEVLDRGWDLMIAHPPCTHLAVSGAAFFRRKRARQLASLQFVLRLMNAPIPMIAIENPMSVIGGAVRPADQMVHPWQFDHGERKATCLWLKNLPPLRPTKIVEGRSQCNRWLPPSPDRWRERSRTYPGIADAMAKQWGTLPSEYRTGFGMTAPAVLDRGWLRSAGWDPDNLPDVCGD